MNNRILYSNNGTIEDMSVILGNYSSGTKALTFTASEDAIYIGSRLPLNHIYFKLSSVSSINASMSVQYYDGNAWVNMVELIDETAGLSSSGFIQFTPDRLKGWMMRSTNYAGESVLGLTSVTIYDLYWLKVTFASDFTATLAWVGNLFSNDADLGVEYPDLVRPATISNYKPGKTNWEEQHVRAAQILVDDLINKNVICGPSQILDWREFTNAAIHKTAEIALNAFGDDYVENVVSARKEYNGRLSKRLYRVDRNNDAIETAGEHHQTLGYFTR